jgi:cyclic pyranopterin phosphate synthase
MIVSLDQHVYNPVTYPQLLQIGLQLSKLTHIRSDGQAAMVDVGKKASSERVAIARGQVTVNEATLEVIRLGNVKKGDVLGVSRLAGIMAAKKTSELIPLCHPIAVTFVDVRLELCDAPPAIFIEAEVRTIGQTGVEMEALTAVSVAALTIYDMAKSVQRDMRIENVRLIRKQGGRSGDVVLE